MRACIGVQVVEQPERLFETLAQIERVTPEKHDLYIIASGPDDITLAALESIKHIPVRRLEGRGGGAAALNELARCCQAEVAVLLESGALPGPRWLEHLLRALESAPDIGLAGPSTNSAWNEQGVFKGAGNTRDCIAATAMEAARVYGDSFRTLEPLYSLGDFCYAVKRSAWEAAGPADEAYGQGPCWEMDYNIRAARAGVRGVWAGAAYVYRHPPGPRRQARENESFERNKRLYQSKFCARQRLGDKAYFRNHCSGDACPNFANHLFPRRTDSGGPDPLVSCILPTADRAGLLPDAIRSFLEQDYPNRELLILDDGREPVDHLVPADPRIRYRRIEPALSIGEKRNLLCQCANGALIAHWDDDDWYPPWRLSAQVRALREASGDICGSGVLLYRDLESGRAYRYRYTGPEPWVGGNTMLYRREFWARQRFQPVTSGEDTLFLWSPLPKKIVDMQLPDLCIGSIHRGNTSPKMTGSAYWEEVPAALVKDAMELAAGPLVSCIMPTRDRQGLLPLTYELFRAQDYRRLELIVIDDGKAYGGGCWEDDSRVRYFRLRSRCTIGEKRNLACRMAAGEIIVHWDDDDWYAPARVRYQVAPILRGEADVTGLANAYTLDLAGSTCWTVSPELHERMFVRDLHGGTLAFRRKLLDGGLAYPAVDLAEDAALLDAMARQGARIRKLENPGLFVYLRHGSNAWRFAAGKLLDEKGWSPGSPPDAFPVEWLERYRAAWAPKHV